MLKNYSGKATTLPIPMKCPSGTMRSKEALSNEDTKKSACLEDPLLQEISMVRRFTRTSNI